MRDCIAILWATDWNDILTAEYLWYEFDKRATGNILDFSVEWHSAILTASLHQASAGRRMIAFRYTSLWRTDFAWNALWSANAGRNTRPMRKCAEGFWPTARIFPKTSFLAPESKRNMTISILTLV